MALPCGWVRRSVAVSRMFDGVVAVDGSMAVIAGLISVTLRCDSASRLI